MFFLFSPLLFSNQVMGDMPSENFDFDDQDLEDEDSTGCTPCEPGTYYDPLTYSNHSQDKCYGCSEGECFTSSCYPCPNGTAQPQSGQSSCDICPVGSISQGGIECVACEAGTQPDGYLTSCVACQTGYFNNATDGGLCLACLAGSYSPNTSACVPCAPGTYNAKEAQKLCHACGPGLYNPRPGSSLASSCLQCNPGTFCKNEANLAPVVCPDDTYCPGRTSEPIPCGWLSTSHVGATECTYKITFYVVVGFLSLLGFILIVVGVVFFLRWRAADDIEVRVFFPLLFSSFLIVPLTNFFLPIILFVSSLSISSHLFFSLLISLF